MKVIILAIREWAKKVYPSVKNHPKILKSTFCSSYEDLYELDIEDYDLLVTIGLSEKIKFNIYDKITTIGLHCAELDRYSYGSPIQNQIIDGILKTKHRIFKLTSGGETSKRSHAHTREFSFEIDLYLHGSIEEVFDQLTYTSIPLLNSYFDSYPNIIWKQWPEEKIVRERRTIDDSKFTMDQFSKMTTKDLYNFIRCLADPYPNFCIEDEEGILFLKGADFKKKVINDEK